MPQSYGDILDITYDWITRVLYLSVSMVMIETSNSDRYLTIWSLPVDNPVFKIVYSSNVLFNDSKIVTTVAPRIGYVVCVCVVLTCMSCVCVLCPAGNCTG